MKLETVSRTAASDWRSAPSLTDHAPSFDFDQPFVPSFGSKA